MSRSDFEKEMPYRLRGLCATCGRHKDERLFNRLIHAPRTSHPFPFPALLIQFLPCFPLFNFTAGLSIFKLKQQGKGTLGAIEKALQSDSDMTRMVSSVWRGEFLIPARAAGVGDLICFLSTLTLSLVSEKNYQHSVGMSPMGVKLTIADHLIL